MKTKILPASLLALLLSAGAELACPTHAIPLPTEAGAGAGKHSNVLLDTPFVKLVSITLHAGTVLPDHKADAAVTLQALAGSGVVVVDGEKTALSPGQMMLLAPGAMHSVTPDGQGDLVILVHYLKGGPAGGASHACPACAGRHQGAGEAHRTE